MDKIAPEDESQHTCLRLRTNGRKRSERGDLEANRWKSGFQGLHAQGVPED
jgi:hypothetical protein